MTAMKVIETGARLPQEVSGEPTAFEERVLAVVALIPRGKVMSYGDVAEYLGEGGARAVGGVMRRHGGEVPWHRVVLSDGRPAPTHDDLAAELLVDDGTPMTPDGRRVDMTRARWDGRVRPGRRPPRALT